MNIASIGGKDGLMRFIEPLLLFIGSFVALGLFGYVAHLIYKLADSVDNVNDSTTSIMMVCFVIGLLIWFAMIMRAIWLIVNPNSTPVQLK